MNTDVTIGRRTYAVAKSPNTSSCVDALGSYDTRTKRNRRKVHPTRYRGTWVISDNTRAALERCELFQDIDRSQLMAVAALVEECSLTPDEMILGEGEVARYIFVIVEGACHRST